MDIKKIVVKAHVRYWEDTEVNGIDDTESGDNVPCKQGELWSPIIDVATGVIENWEIGKTAKIHYKITDCCAWELLDENSAVVKSQDDGYVPNSLSPAERGYGDYIIMNIDEKGQIDKWCFDISDFDEDDD